MRSAPKKYLVETEDGGVEDTGLGQEEYYGYEPENMNFGLDDVDAKPKTQNRQRLGYRDPTPAPRNTPPPYVRTQRPFRTNSKIRIL